MGRRNRSRSHFSSKVYALSRDKLLKQDFAVLGVAWPFEREPGQTNAVQGSTLNSNAMETNASSHLGFKSCVTLRRLHRKGQLDDYLRVGPDKRAIYLETDPYGLPSLREHVQKHTACRFDSSLWQVQSWTDVANGYLDLAKWGAPPWNELQWRTLRNVIELAENGE